MEHVMAWVDVSREAAVLAGHSEFGRTKIRVDVASLTGAQRRELLRCPVVLIASDTGYAHDPYRMPNGGAQLRLPDVAEATTAALGRLLDARPAALEAAERAEAEAKRAREAKAAEEAARESAAVAEALAFPLDAWIFEGRVQIPVTNVLIHHRPEIMERVDQARDLLRQRQDEAKKEAAAERLAWIAEHGSDRLKRMAEHGIEHTATYRDERLALERPGWVWESHDEYPKEARNPPDAALDLLDAAKRICPDADLVYLVVEDEDEGDGVRRGFYAARSMFEGRWILTTKRVPAG